MLTFFDGPKKRRDFLKPGKTHARKLILPFALIQISPLAYSKIPLNPLFVSAGYFDYGFFQK